MFKIDSPERHFFINMICGLFYKKRTRLVLRKLLDSPILEMIRFVKKDSNIKHPKMKFFTGWRGKALVIAVNKKYVYKFSPKINDFDTTIAEREKSITTEMSKISNIYIPVPTILKYKYGIVRKYEYINGVSLHKANDKYIIQNGDKFVPEVAKFLYIIAKHNPKKLYKYKKNQTDSHRYAYGWCQGDLGDNLILDTKTNKINAIIDWENAYFNDFSRIFALDKRETIYNFMQQVKKYYDRLYYENNKKD